MNALLPIVRVSDHAIRRYAELSMGIFTEASSEAGHLRELTRRGVDIGVIRKRIESLAALGTLHGAPVVIGDGIKVLIVDGAVPTVLTKHYKNKETL